jgi:DeoR/GlpR family transcriptional regulator of sugar metabolism
MPSTRGSASRRRPGGTRATGRERRDRILQLIRERPGITVPDLAKELNVDAPPIYRVIRKLQAEGTITKDGKTLRMAR